jgi:osmotically-inducible protein OsmY
MIRRRMSDQFISDSEDHEFILDRDYSLDGGVTMVRNDFQHGFENKEKALPRKVNKLDRDILEDASEILSKNKRLDASDLKLHVHDGIIKITGWVDSRENKKEAERCIELISGIKILRI